MGACPDCGREPPGAGFSFCPWCGAAVRASLRDSGKRATVTLLFADLVGSTELGARLDPEVLRGVLSSYWDAARDAVERHGGTVEKFIGDAVVAVFGIPVVREDDALRATRAATDLHAAVTALNVDLRSRHAVELVVRVGINTGPVMIADATGDVALMAGDAANVAARLEQAAGPGEVLLGAATHLLVRDHVDVEPLRRLMVKGKADPVVAYRLLGVHPVGGPMRRRRFSGALVGRRRQLLQARMAYDTAVEENACALLTVVGAPGVGKSRLVDELLSQVRGDALVLQGRCLSYGEGITYWAVAEMLRPLVDGDGTWGAALVGVEHAEDISIGLDTMLGRSSAATGGQMAWAFRRLLESLAQVRPVVVVVDDVQWAESALLDLLDHLTDLSRGAAILLVCMARPEFLLTRPSWGSARRHATTTVLAPLSDADSAALTAGLLGSGLDPELLSRIMVAAEGIPLYVEELVASLADQDRLAVDDDGTWALVGDLDDIAVPPTVQALLAARLDRLPRDQRVVVDAASVIGQTFYPHAVTSLASLDDRSTHEALEGLVRSDLVRPVDSDVPGHDALGFTHLLIRDAAYDAMPKEQRAVAHYAFAHWLERTGTGWNLPELVASHLERCCTYRAELGNPDPDLVQDTAHRLLTCAERARALGDVVSAAGLLGAAAALVPPGSAPGIAVTLARAEAANAGGDYALAASLAELGEDVATRAGATSAVFRARMLRRWVALQTDTGHDLGAADTFTEEAIAALSELGDDAGLAQAYELRCYEHNFRGRADACGIDGRLGLAAAARARNLDLVSRLMERRMYCFGGGSGSLAEEELAVEELVVEFGAEPLLVPSIERFRMILLAHQGSADPAIAYARAGSALALEQGNIHQAFILQNLATDLLWDGGDLPAVIEALTSSIGLLGFFGANAYRSTQLAELSVALARLGREADAWTALEASRRLGQPGDVANAILQAAAEGVLLARRGEDAASESRFAEGLALVVRADSLRDARDLWLARSDAREILGDGIGALAAASEALVLAERQRFVPQLRVAQARVAACEALLAGSG